ncbi:MAG: hypothetical protein ABIV63_17625 [Caldimonas sp.]
MAAPEKVVTPALFTSASRRPQRSIADYTIALQSASAATSPHNSKVSAPAVRQAADDASASILLFE